MINKILARVNGRDITEMDLEHTLRGLQQHEMAQFQTAEGREKLLDSIIRQELLYNFAMDNGFQKDPEYIERVEEVKRVLMQQYAAMKIMSNVNPKEEEIKAFYSANKSLFVVPEKLKANHILLQTEEEAKAIKEKIDNGLDFKEAANENSQCSEKNGGDLGWFSKGKMVQEFEDAVFSMVVGEVKGPVKTQFGYHLIYLEERKEEEKKTYEEAKDSIIRRLTNEIREKTYIEKTDGLKEEYKVELLG